MTSDEFVLAADDAVVVRTRERFPRCTTGHLIHNPAEMVGQCVVCGGYICKECEILRCSLDNDLVCRDHCAIDKGRVICCRHGFFRQILFFLGS